jgi:hypothetical protein
MPRYVIERNVPGVHRLNDEGLRNLSRKSNDILHGMGPDIQWVESYVTENKLYCVYVAANEELVAEHARRGEFPADRIARVNEVIDPTTGE